MRKGAVTAEEPGAAMERLEPKASLALGRSRHYDLHTSFRFRVGVRWLKKRRQRKPVTARAVPSVRAAH